MYVLLFDRTVFEDKDNRTYHLKGKRFDECMEVIENFYNRIHLDNEKVDKILFYTAGKEHDKESAIEADLDSINLENDQLTIEFSNPSNIKATNEEIRRHLYGYLRNNELISQNEYVKTLNMIDKIEDYDYVKGLRVGFDSRKFSEQVNALRKNNDLLGIVNLFHEIKDISKHPIWNNQFLLNEFAYALSNLILDGNTDLSEDEYFKINDRILEIKPDFTSALTSRAYYHSMKYQNNKDNNDYEQAVNYYERLIKASDHKYKDKFRLANLKYEYLRNENEKHLNNPAWDAFAISIKDLYGELVKDYDYLTDDYKNKYLNYYRSSVNNYIVLSREYGVNYWYEYFNAVVDEREFNPILLGKDAVDSINNELSLLKNYENTAIPKDFGVNSVKFRPSAFDVYGRIAQLQQYLGFIGFINDDPKYNEYFEESNDLIEDKILTKAKKFMETDPGKFAYPHFVKEILGINQYMLGEAKQAHRTLGNLKINGKLQNAKILILEEELVEAVDLLMEIEETDPSYKEARKLLDRFSM